MNTEKLILAAREIDRLAAIQAERSRQWQQLARDARQPGADRTAIQQRKQRLDAAVVVDYGTAIEGLRAALRSRMPKGQRDDVPHLSQLLAACSELVTTWQSQAMAAVPDDYRKRGLERKYLNGDCHAGGVSDCADDLGQLVREHSTKTEVPS